jgi:hypothetical protein
MWESCSKSKILSIFFLSPALFILWKDLRLSVCLSGPVRSVPIEFPRKSISAHITVPMRFPVRSVPIEFPRKCNSVNPHNCTYAFPRRCIITNEFPRW